jgi:hypothetical protein
LYIAQEYLDFIPVYTYLIFNEYTPNSQPVPVTILNDVCLEEDIEYFSVVLSSYMDCVEIVNESVTIRIDDDDRAKITLDDSFYKISEDGGYVHVCVELKNDIKRDVGFELSVTDITAQGGSDFISPAVLNGTFTVGGATEICFTFNITDDACVEDKESFEVYLSSSDPYVDVHISSAIIAIWDNDYALFNVESDTYFVDEDDGPATLCVVLTDGCLERDVIIDFATIEATAEGMRYLYLFLRP